MNGKPFFDTNILIYAFRNDNDPRSKIALDLLSFGGIISVQMLNEFASVAKRKLSMTWNEVSASLSAVLTLCPQPVPISLAMHRSAVEIANQYGYGIYDALVIAAAIESSCDTLYSEDMQSGQRIKELTIRNPF